MKRVPTDLSLEDFLDSLESLLRQLVRGQPFHVMPVQLDHLIELSWNEIQGSFDKVRAWLTDSTKRRRATAHRALEKVGLTGVQLAMKLLGFFSAIDRLAKHTAMKVNQFVRHVRECLRWANIVLGSLAAVCIAAEPIKEFKEVLEAAIDYTGATARHPRPLLNGREHD